jgi:hypothetical protein
MRFTVTQSVMALLCFSVVSGCTVSTQQMIGAVDRVRDEWRKKVRPARPSDKWLLSFMGGEYLLTGTRAQDNGWMFSDELGITVRFDGSEIRSVEGLPGAMGRISVIGEASTRQIERGGNRLVRLECLTPTEWEFSSNRSGWRLTCHGSLNGIPTATQHSVEWDPSRTPVFISSTLIPGTAPLTLRRVPAR